MEGVADGLGFRGLGLRGFGFRALETDPRKDTPE